jgi:hypothetical protein
MVVDRTDRGHVLHVGRQELERLDAGKHLALLPACDFCGLASNHFIYRMGAGRNPGGSPCWTEGLGNGLGCLSPLARRNTAAIGRTVDNTPSTTEKKYQSKTSKLTANIPAPAHSLGEQPVVQQQSLAGRDELVGGSVEQQKGGIRGIDVRSRVGSRDCSEIVTDRLLGARAVDPLSGVVARAQEHPLVCGVEVGADLREVGRAKLVDDRLDIAALVQVVAEVELLDAVRGADHRGDVAARGLAPDGDLSSIDVHLDNH